MPIDLILTNYDRTKLINYRYLNQRQHSQNGLVVRVELFVFNDKFSVGFDVTFLWIN